jgi:hypothetical protein
LGGDSNYTPNQVLGGSRRDIWLLKLERVSANRIEQFLEGGKRRKLSSALCQELDWHGHNQDNSTKIVIPSRRIAILEHIH